MIIQEWIRPKHIAEAYEAFTKEDRKAVLFGGGAWLKLTHKHIDLAIDLQDCLKSEIEVKEHMISIGAMTPLEAITTHPYLNELASGILAQACKVVMGPSVRNVATIGGTIMGKYGFSDVLPVLLAFDAILQFHKHGNVWLREYLESGIDSLDILTHVLIPKDSAVGYYHSVKKTALDFSIINIAIYKTPQLDKIAVGARPQIAIRAYQAESLLNEADVIDEAFLQEVVNQIILECKVGGNQVASQAYRTQLLQTLAMRGLKEVYHL